MGTVYHPKSQIRRIRRELTRKDDKCFGLYIRASMVLDRFGPELMSGIELQVVRFILGRTLSFSKYGETIAFNSFLEGLEGEKGWVTKGTGLSETSIRKALRGLLDRDLITIHAFKDGHQESDYRLYEVNLTNILVYKIFVNEGETEDEPLSRITTPPYRGVTDLNKEHIKIETSSIEEESASSPPRLGVVGMAKRIEVDCNEDPNELVKRISGRAQAGQAVRIAKSADGVPKNKWQTNDLQALLDKARATAVHDGFTVPRVMVIAKAIGVLHKRMRDREVKDPLGVFTWILKHWGTIASANRRAKARQTKETKAVQSEMSMAPNFNDLAYRFPYMMAMYENRDQEAQEKKSEAAANLERRQTAREVQQTVAEARKELARAQDLRAKQEREEMLEDNVRRVRRTRAQPVTDDDDFVFPLHKSERS